MSLDADVLFLFLMPECGHRDWWVLGCEPIEGYLLVKCHLTQRTGVVKNASAEELLTASAKNFTSYPWTEPERVTETPLKPHVIDLAKRSQSLSTFMQTTKLLASRHHE
jgi:hypothetical protein